MLTVKDFLTDTFKNDEIKSFQDDEGEFWFQLSHVCKVLDLTNSTNAMKYHTDETERLLLEPGYGLKVWFVSETGLYGLIFASKTLEAKAFKKWVKETLKKYRKQGYLIGKNDAETLKAAKAEIQKIEEEKQNLLADNQVLVAKVEELQTTQEELIDTSYQLMLTIIEINSVISEWSIDLVPSIRNGIKSKATAEYLRLLMQQLTSGLNRLLEVDDWVQAIDSVMLDLPDDLEDEDYELKKRVFDDFILQLTKRRLKNL